MSGYSNFVVALAELMAGIECPNPTTAAPFDDDDANTILPAIIADAEGMMYRDPDLDFLQQRATTPGSSTAGGSRTLAIPGQCITVEQLVLVTPSGSAPAAGTRVNASRVALEFINATYPQESVTQVPTYGDLYYANFNQSSVIIAPTPDNAYATEFYGVVSQTPLSSDNADTILTNFYPDVFLAAACIFMSGFQKNFSAMSDNAPQALSWQAHYDSLKKGAAFISARQRFLSAGSTAYPPAPQNQGTR